MNGKINLTITVSAALLCAASAGAAVSPAGTNSPPITNTLSLEALVAEALERNSELKFYEAEIDAARAEARNAGRLARPELEVSVGYKNARDRANRFLGEGAAWSVELKQPLEWPGRLGLRKAIANRDVALAELGLAQFRFALAGRVRSVAHDLAVAQQRTVASRAAADRFSELRQTFMARDPAGLTPLLETRVIEASTVKAEHTAAEAEHDVEHLAIELNYLRGRSPTTPLRVAETPLHFGVAPGLNELFAAAATNNFELRLRVAEFEQQGFRISLARNERFPSFSVGPVISEERAGDHERIVGVALSLPLPLWQNNRARVETAEARRGQAEAALESTRRRIERDLADHAHKYEHALGVLAKWRPDAMEHFREAAELADRHYRLGAVPVNTYVELQRQYVEAVEALLEARREALAAAHTLELLSGLALPVSSETTREQGK
jgi:outer membrane protein, heavy metal efflux system